MARKIPVGEATEIDLEIPDTRNLDKGLHAPVEPPRSLGAAGPRSAASIADAYQGPPRPTVPSAPPQPVREALAAEARGGLRGVVQGAMERGVQALRGVGPSVAGVALNLAADKAFAPSGAAVQGPYPDGNNVAPGQIPGQSEGIRAMVPKAVAPSFFRDTETGRNVGNIINAVPGVTSLPIQSLRAGSNAARVADVGGDMLRSAAMTNVLGTEAPKLPSVLPSALSAPTAPEVRQPFSDARFESQRRGGDPNDAGAVQVGPGNSFSGTNIKEGFRYSDGRKNTGTVTSLDTSAGAASDIRELARLRSQPAAGPDPYGPGANGGITGIADGRGLQRRELDMAAKDSKGGMESNQGYRARIAGAVRGLNDFDNAQQQLPIEEMRNNTIRRGNDQNNATARYMNDQNNATSLSNNRSTNATAKAAAAADQANRNRAYKLDVAKFGVDVAEKNRTAATAVQKAQQERLENTFRTRDGDGKDVPDMAKIGAYNTAVDATIPKLVQELMASKNPALQAKAKELSERGQAAMDPNDQAMMMKLFNDREHDRSTQSMLPSGGEFVDSNNLLDFRQKQGDAGIEKRGLTPHRINFEGGGSSTVNDRRYQGGANFLTPDWFKSMRPNGLDGIRQPE